MPIYVDEVRDYGWKQGPSCHMFTDVGGERELRKFARLAGIGQSYFHNSKNFPHFDLTELNRHRALVAGAIESTSRKAVEIRIENAKKTTIHP